MFDWIIKFLNTVLSILPKSPLRPIIEGLDQVEWLAALNWLVPVGTLSAIGAAWLVAIGTFYLYQVVLRWVKLAGAG